MVSKQRLVKLLRPILLKNLTQYNEKDILLYEKYLIGCLNNKKTGVNLKIPLEIKNNILDSVFKKYNYLEGPVTIGEYYSKKYNKWIYILGDEHVSDSTCKKSDDKTVNINNFIENLIVQNKNKTIDFFFEAAFVNKLKSERGQTKKSFLSESNEYFKDCLQVRKDICKYKNVRMHYSDIRNIIREKYFEKIWYYYELIFNKELYNLEKILNENNINNFFESVKKMDNEVLLNITKINKQLENINDEDLKQKVINYFRKIIEEFKYNLTIKINKKEYLIDHKQFTLLYGYLIEYLAWYMDFYLISRIFRNFKGSASPKYIFIYVGELHSKRYINFLTKQLDFVTVNYSSSEIKNKNFQCVNISKFKQPFFT